MTGNDFLEKVLRAQSVQPGSPEMKTLEQARADVEALVRSAFSDCSPTIRYGGSKMKNTMNLEDFDLDIIVYFPRHDTRAGKTIKEIYWNVHDALRTKYSVDPRTTALRVKDEDRDLKIDVVPGRFIDDSKTFAFVHQNGGPKDYLQTNLDRHIEHVRDSGHTNEIRLTKLWRPCVGLKIRTFPLELMVIKILDASRATGLEARMLHVLTAFRDTIDSISIEDPANSGNDLSDALDSDLRRAVSIAAASTLRTVASHGWEPVFRAVMDADSSARNEALRVNIISSSRTQPWCA